MQNNIDNLKIQKMNLNDLEKIKDNLINDYDDFWTYEIFKEELGNNNSSYLVLLDENNDIISFGGIKVILNESNLMNIVTKKDKRNNGYAKKILKELIDISKKKDCSSITLEVNENNLYAIKLYEHFNFQEVGRRKKYYKNDDAAVLMTLEL